MVDHSAVEQLVAVSGLEETCVAAALRRFAGDADEALLYLLSDHAVSSPRAGRPPADADQVTPSSESSSEDSDEFEDGTNEPEEAPDLETPYWGELPPDVMHVLGHWLAEHLGKHVERQTEPEYLHPLRSHADLLARGHQRCSATLGMLRAIQACRQTCRIWRDDIPYSKATHLALDGVAFSGAPPPRNSRLSPPPQTKTLAPTLRAPVVWTWWRGSRVIRPMDWYDRNPRPIDYAADTAPGRQQHTNAVREIYASVPHNAPIPRCPACRTICTLLRTPDHLEHLALFNFMKSCGLGSWYGDIRQALKVQTIEQLRRLTEQDLLTGLSGQGYSGQPSLCERVPQFVQRVRTTPVLWSEEAIESTACQVSHLFCLLDSPQASAHCGNQLLSKRCEVVTVPERACVMKFRSQECNQTAGHCTHEAEDVRVRGCQAVGVTPTQKIICAKCQMLFCCACAVRHYRDGRPQHPSEILPLDFSARFSNLRSLSLCDLLLPSLPPQLAECVTLRTLDVSGNSLNELPDWLGTLAVLEHLDLSEQRRGLRVGGSCSLSAGNCLASPCPDTSMRTEMSVANGIQGHRHCT